jgi:transposase
LKWRVSDSLWERLAPILTDPPRRFRYPGRARYSPRQCLEGILYVLYTDTPWLQVPYRELGLPSGETCRRRLEEWSRRVWVPKIRFRLQTSAFEDDGQSFGTPQGPRGRATVVP